MRPAFAVFVCILLVGCTDQKLSIGCQSEVEEKVGQIRQLLPNGWSFETSAAPPTFIAQYRLSSERNCTMYNVVRKYHGLQPFNETINPSVALAFSKRWSLIDYNNARQTFDACEKAIKDTPIAAGCTLREPTYNTQGCSVFVSASGCTNETVPAELAIQKVFE
ncbi:MAG: hypothetical protein V1837_05990 [Candidatus Woesearchaeota archaeon]